MARFVISNRMAGKKKEEEELKSREHLEKIHSVIKGFAEIQAVHDVGGKSKRRTLLVDSHPDDLRGHLDKFGPDVLVEPEVYRHPAVAFGHKSMLPLMKTNGSASTVAGFGDEFVITVTSSGKPVINASVTVTFYGQNAIPTVVPKIGHTDEKGKLTLGYDASQRKAVVALIVPEHGAWSLLHQNPVNGSTVELPALPVDGPLGWWHRMIGVSSYSADRGKGIRVGVVDSGVGPHPYLDGVEGVGAFVNGSHEDGAKASEDVGDHGSHVSGIIGALIPDDSKHYGGIAAGAKVLMARAFATPERASNADIANAIDHLALNHEVDIINLSLGGSQPSIVERDALQVALESGALPIAAADNRNGQPDM